MVWGGAGGRDTRVVGGERKRKWEVGGDRIFAPAAYILFASAIPTIAFGEQLNRETAGELFGMLISVTFIQEAIKGVVSEFNIPERENGEKEQYQFEWLNNNGLLAVIFSFGVLITSLKSRRARSWRYGTGFFRSFVADYGVLLMVVLWTALSYAVPQNVPSEVPRRLFASTLWDSGSLYHWAVIKDMGKVPVVHIFAAIIPALMITGLYLFDHSVASQMAQPKEFNLKNPPAYHYDILLLGVMDMDHATKTRFNTLENKLKP
ncbi:hypothetical protein ACS0TY_029523 [Phlomoides rotata]